MAFVSAMLILVLRSCRAHAQQTDAPALVTAKAGGGKPLKNDFDSNCSEAITARGIRCGLFLSREKVV